MEGVQAGEVDVARAVGKPPVSARLLGAATETDEGRNALLLTDASEPFSEKLHPTELSTSFVLCTSLDIFEESFLDFLLSSAGTSREDPKSLPRGLSGTDTDAEVSLCLCVNEESLDEDEDEEGQGLDDTGCKGLELEVVAADELDDLDDDEREVFEDE